MAVAAITISSCEKKVNDWEVDPSHQRLFKSLVFGPSRIGATDIEIRYTQTVSADKYIFEFSKDYLEFNEIVKTVEILADTLTPFAPSTTPARVEYRTVFDELDGMTAYSVRMKGVNSETGEESNYSEMHFITSTEQLFGLPEIYVNRVVLHWPVTDRVTHVVVLDNVTNSLIKQIDLTAQDKANGSLEITDLLPGTTYIVAIFNEDVQRGLMRVKTSGLAGGHVITVDPGDDIPTLVKAGIDDGKSDIILMFSGGQTYNLGAITLPSGVSNVSVTGDADTDGNKPRLNISSFKLSDATYGKVVFENVGIHAPTGSAFLITQDQGGAHIEGYSFINCYIENFGNGVVRLNNAVTVGSIIFDNCLIHKNGGWGVANVGGSTAVVDSIVFTNSTLTDLATQLMDVRVAVKKIVVKNCTFYNQNAGMTQLLRFDTNRLPLELFAGNNIIAGTNNGGKLNAMSYDHANFGLSISFAGSYRTNEFEEERASRGFKDITLFNGTADDLFMDPAQHDFRIKPGNGFGGRGSAGDPRWF